MQLERLGIRSGWNCSAYLTHAGQQEVKRGRFSPFLFSGQELTGLFHNRQVRTEGGVRRPL